MILLLVRQTFKNKEERDAYYAALTASGIPSASRAEHGNLMYDYFFSADRENEIILIEKWESSDALSFHQNTPHFKAIPALKVGYSIESTIERFDI